MESRAKTILVVDDEAKIMEVVTSYLANRGYEVRSAHSGQEAINVFNQEAVSLILLDLMLPDMSGEEVCKAIRKRSRVPIIMVTAKVQEQHVLEGLQMGADDYILKPFSLKEMEARIEAVLRRSEPYPGPLAKSFSFHDGDLMVDFEKNEVKKKQMVIALTPSEMNILAVLIKFPGKVFSRSELIDLALGEEFFGVDRVIDNHVKNLRHKIEDDSKNPTYIVTIHGLGYKFGGV